MPTSPQTIVRHYNTAADRDLDAARMVQGGWFVTQVGQNGEQEQVTYSTTAPPGRALLPHQIGVSLRHSNRRVFATVAAIGLLLVCALVAAVALAGGDAEANSVAPNTGRMWQGVPLYPDATLLERTTDTVSVYGTQHDPAQVSSWFDREWRRAGLTYQFDLVKDGRTFHFYQSGSVTYAYAVTKGRDKPYLIGLIVNR